MDDPLLGAFGYRRAPRGLGGPLSTHLGTLWAPDSGQAREPGAEHVLADLAGRGEREGVGEQPASRHLEPGQPFPAVAGQISLAGAALRAGAAAAAGALLRNAADDRADDLAPEPVRDADHGDLGHAGVGEQDGLDLARVDVLAAPDDHFLDPARDPAVAAFVHRAQVAGMQPAVPVDGRGGRLRVAQVAVHDQVATGADLPYGTVRYRLACQHVGDLDLGLRQRPAERLGPVCGRVVRPGHGDRAVGLGLPEGEREEDPESRLYLPDQLRRDGRAAR